MLFNLHIEIIFQIAPADKELGIKVNGVLISNIRYAEDTALLANSLQELQEIVENVNQIGERYGLEINVKKTKFMIVSPAPHADAKLRINNDLVERVNRFKYLGSMLDHKCDDDIEIKCRVGQTKITYQKMRRTLCHLSLHLPIKICVLQCYVWLVLLYGAETWSIKAKSMNRLEICEMWLHRNKR